MDEKMINKLFNKFKTKLKRKNTTLEYNPDYVFSMEEIETINKENKEKIVHLKEQTVKIKKPSSEKTTFEILDKLESNKEHLTEEVTKPIIEDKNKFNNIVKEKERKPKQSFINLEEKNKQLVMDKWKEINLNEIDKDILEAKDLLNHNYTIIYADEAARFIHNIRKKYEVVICYLIGFNNEKQGIYDKTTISSKIDEEWKYLNNYIKILEKIRNFKKQ